ncbi:hypothetical protein P153DRAFT_391482 [Dothidotthia symphoricarpi CBS 119687]|uniref:Uncharacterized protein n=1 Tax=Dothidotthia symphoricarpi CBS 119687 TaxID=1392245 RepID=A0A6A5ZYZ7_9PLEO|nr:uncharacterized protein P153DRAFT_391482 [Dothidotthia symphoricarpi CBS 119687]KAF2123541.1 hypothetical protein P153DRAFT_391482 [Dothidotthia symphoricarpi CBS 119687]
MTERLAPLAQNHTRNPNPFIIVWCDHTYPLNTFLVYGSDMPLHKALELAWYHKQHDIHTIRPTDRPTYTAETNVMEIFPSWRKRERYVKRDNTLPGTSSGTIVQLSRLLSGLVAEPKEGNFQRPPPDNLFTSSKHKNMISKSAEEREQKVIEIKNHNESIKRGVALIALEMLKCHPNITTCMTIMFNQLYGLSSASDFEATRSPYPPHYALWLEFEDGVETVLQVTLDLMGRSTHETLRGDWEGSCNNTLKGSQYYR